MGEKRGETMLSDTFLSRFQQRSFACVGDDIGANDYECLEGEQILHKVERK